MERAACSKPICATRAACPRAAWNPGDARDHLRSRPRREADLDNPVVGVLIRNRLGIDVFGTNTRIEGVDLGSVAAGETFEVEFTFDCLLTRQDYTLTVATQYAEGYSQDWLDDALSFSVVDSRDVAGLANFKTTVTWRRRMGNVRSTEYETHEYLKFRPRCAKKASTAGCSSTITTATLWPTGCCSSRPAPW